MTLTAHWSVEARWLTACFIGFCGLFGSLDPGLAIAAAGGVLVFLARFRTGGSSASTVAIEGSELVARFTFRPEQRMPLASIAAVEVRRSSWASRSWGPMTFVTVFRRDTPGLVEIAALSEDAEPFLAALGPRARMAGATLAPFAVPRRHCVHDLLPLFAPLAVLAVYAQGGAWRSVAPAFAVFVLFSVLSWRRFAMLAKSIARGTPSPELGTWRKLLRAS